MKFGDHINYLYVGGEMERYVIVLISENFISSATAMILNYSDRTKWIWKDTYYTKWLGRAHETLNFWI